MKKNIFLLGMLAMTLAFGFFEMSCLSLAGAATGAAITNATQSSQDKKVHKAVDYAISEIQKVLPGDAVVWIHKGKESAVAERNSLGVVTSTSGAVDTAVDDITAALIQKGTRLVDRDNTTLVQAEQKYQMGGDVNDQDIVSAGKAAGANILVTVSVVANGSKQRLQIRVVNIEKGVPLMQSDSSDNWSI